MFLVVYILTNFDDSKLHISDQVLQSTIIGHFHVISNMHKFTSWP